MKQDIPLFLLMKNCFLMLQDCTFSIWIRALILSWWAEWFKDIAKRTTTVFRVHWVQERVEFPYDINNKRSLHSKRPNTLMQSYTFDRSAGFNRTQQTLNGGTDGYLPGFSIRTAFLCVKVFAKNTNKTCI